MTLDEALTELLGNQPHDPDDRTALVAAAAEAWRRRHVNTEAGASVIAALLKGGLSYRQIHQLTGIPPTTAHRWAAPPPTLDAPESEPADRPEPPTVVAGIVVSEHGVLVGQRIDGKPPWTFIAGEIEPGESPTDAVTREVKEETGLIVHAAQRPIGRRVHPKTGRTMIYLPCEPTHGTDVWVGDADELVQVRWVPTLAELDELLPGMYQPVHDYLERALGS